MFFDERIARSARSAIASSPTTDVALHEPAARRSRASPSSGSRSSSSRRTRAEARGDTAARASTCARSRVAREAIAYVSPLADSIFAVQGLGSHPILLAGEGARRASVLAEVVRGERVCAFALTEPEAGSDVASMRTHGAPRGRHVDPRRREGLHLQRRHRASLRRVRERRSREGQEGHQRVPRRRQGRRA